MIITICLYIPGKLVRYFVNVHSQGANHHLLRESTMKKILLAASHMLLMLLTSSQAQATLASAYFGNDHLTQVFYTAANDKVEIGVDLGALGTDFSLSDQNKTLKTANLAGMVTAQGAVLKDLSMGIYMDSLDRRTDSVWDHYFVTTTSTTPDAPAAYAFYNWYLFMNSAAATIANYYSGGQVAQVDDGSVVMADPNNPSSYRTQMNMSGFVPGTYRTTNMESASAPHGELNLVEMTGAYQDLYLWHFAFDGSPRASHLVAGADAEYSAILRFYADGTTVINPAAVPLPATVWFLCSGLVGLVSIRRMRQR